MPQMAPLSWTILYLLFSLGFMGFMIMNFYQNSTTIKVLDKKMKLNNINWKW
uniref:ATP synthase complex subunit 8 n=1 Tax=Coraebus cavifrons TaxID=2823020 RepID=A0A8A6W4F2_9COLE|nr:ATP synthase F0 subunit 8 [Coraebus cavifrons]QTK22426.1 ATP synthase F0 subunit 8 [Coraebus cavifrons]